MRHSVVLPSSVLRKNSSGMSVFLLNRVLRKSIFLPAAVAGPGGVFVLVSPSRIVFCVKTEGWAGRGGSDGTATPWIGGVRGLDWPVFR